MAETAGNTDGRRDARDCGHLAASFTRVGLAAAQPRTSSSTHAGVSPSTASRNARTALAAFASSGRSRAAVSRRAVRAQCPQLARMERAADERRRKAASPEK